jgi:hypothetical protein
MQAGKMASNGNRKIIVPHSVAGNKMHASKNSMNMKSIVQNKIKMIGRTNRTQASDSNRECRQARNGECTQNV